MTKILESVYSAVGQLVNRSFLIVGLAPALVFAGGVHLYHSGRPGLDALSATVTSWMDSLAAAAWPVLLILLLAFLFLAARGGLQYLLVEFPFGPLRDAFLTLSLQRARSLTEAHAEWERHLSAFRWWKEGRFVRIVAPSATPQARGWAEGAAEAERGIRAQLATGIPLSPQWVARVGAALHRLREAAIVTDEGQALPADVQTELDRWRAWHATDAAVRELLDLSAEVAEGSAATLRRRRDAYPRKLRWVQPTRFGSRLAALDDYAELRLGMATGELWTRLWGILPEGARKEVQEAQQAVDASINLMTALLVLGLWIGGAEVLEWTTRLRGSVHVFDAWAAGLLLAALLLARLLYLSALVALGGLGETMVRWIDLERIRLLTELGLPEPAYETDVQQGYATLKRHLVLGWPIKRDFRVSRKDRKG
ncbi:MAG: hypothetical protein R3E10_06805 [Gemmatimonadota bacterium]